MVAARETVTEQRATPPSRTRLREFMERVRQQAIAVIAELVPKGLYARALIIIIAPIVLLEGVVAFVFMERHWNAVTRRLSEATVRTNLVQIYARLGLSRQSELALLVARIASLGA